MELVFVNRLKNYGKKKKKGRKLYSELSFFTKCLIAISNA